MCTIQEKLYIETRQQKATIGEQSKNLTKLQGDSEEMEAESTKINDML